jgi:hypothetical protein
MFVFIVAVKSKTVMWKCGILQGKEETLGTL